jgi:hypothetical protein
VLRREREDLPSVVRERRIIEHGERFGTRSAGGLKGPWEVAWTSDRKGQHLKPQLRACPFHLCHVVGGAIIRIKEHGQAREAWEDLFE